MLLDSESAYISDIPADAVERVIETHDGIERRAEYYVSDTLSK